MLRKRFLALTIVVLNLAMAFAQQPQEPAVSPPKFPTNQPPPLTQKPPEIDSQDVVKITTNLVQVDAVVLKDGKLVTDLTADDFELFEDGKPQPITNFSFVSNIVTTPAPPPTAKNSSSKDKLAPPIPPAVLRPHETRRTVALVVDDMGMSFQSVSDARRLLRKFIVEQLAPNDLVAIIHTSGEVGALQQFTADRRVLNNAIDKLRWYPCSRVGLHVFTPLGTEATRADAPCGGSRNITSTLQVVKFIVDGMREIPGRKSLVLMSDYLPIETQEPATNALNVGDGDISDVRTNYTAQLRKVAEMAIRASVVIYSVDTRGLAYTGITAMDSLFNPMSGVNGRAPTSTSSQITNVINSTMSARSMAMISGREGADLIARQTGGFLVRNSNDFGLKQIAQDQNGYYLLAYKPGDATFNRHFHHIKLTVKRKGMTVRTRNGFVGVRETEVPRPLSTTGQLAKALISPFGASEITVRLTSLFTNFDQGSLLRSLLYIDSKDLTFLKEPDGAQVATFDMGIILFGENGRVLDQQMRQVTVRLKKDIYENAMQSGLVYTLDTPIKQAGAFQYRIALRDQNSSRIGSAGQFIEVPNLANGRMALSGMVVLKDIPDKPPAMGAAPQAAREAITAGPAVRQFHSGDKLIYAYSIYNAALNEATHQPQLSAQARIFHDGKLVFTGPVSQIDAAQSDLKRIPSVGRLQLGLEFQPGQYVLQVVVTDQLSKDKQQVTAQWIDFEIVK
jgi:VWFA-related protein